MVVDAVTFVVDTVVFAVSVVFAVVAELVLCIVVAVVPAVDVCDAIVVDVSAQEQINTEETASASVPSKSFFICETPLV